MIVETAENGRYSVYQCVWTTKAQFRCKTGRILQQLRHFCSRFHLVQCSHCTQVNV